MARTKNNPAPPSTTTANIGFEAKLWLTADKLRNNMDAAEYKHVVLGPIFLKYISDTFEEHRAKFLAGKDDYQGANAEDPDEYKAENVFWVPSDARWSHLQASAKQPTIGKTVDDAMVAIDRDNPPLKGVLPKDYTRPGLDKQCLGELIDLIVKMDLVASNQPSPQPSPNGRRQGEGMLRKYEDFPGFCKAATTAEIAAHGHMLPPDRYVGAEEVEEDGDPFEEKMPRRVAELHAQFGNLSTWVARADSAKLEQAMSGARSRGVSREYLFSLFTSTAFVGIYGTLVTRTTGSHQRIRPESVMDMKIVIPSAPLIRAFAVITKPMFDRINRNTHQSRTIATLRVTLLPKLLSGELIVAGASKPLSA